MQLDPDPAEWRALATTVVVHLTDVLRGLPDAPASAFDGVDDVVADPAIRRPPPEAGRPLAELLRVLDRAAGVGLNPSTPGYLAFIPGSGLVSAALAGLIGDLPASRSRPRRSSRWRPTSCGGSRASSTCPRRQAGCSPPAGRWRRS